MNSRTRLVGGKALLLLRHVGRCWWSGSPATGKAVACLFASHVRLCWPTATKRWGLRSQPCSGTKVACYVSNEAAVNAMIGVAQGIGGEKIDTLVNVA